jgi:hypothetical protein
MKETSSRIWEILEKHVALILMLAVLTLSLGLPNYFHRLHAAALTSVSDTLTNSDPSGFSNHAIAFTTTTAVAASSTIVVTLDPDTSLFDLTTLAYANITVTGMTKTVACSGAAN